MYQPFALLIICFAGSKKTELKNIQLTDGVSNN